MDNILKHIGNTPLIQINKHVWAKLESVNPSGSIKDRIAKYMVEMAEKRGELKKGYTVIEATSGNTGISLAMVCAIKGYMMIAVMPENTSKKKIKMIELFGAKIVLTPKKEKLKGAIEKTHYLAKKYKKIWLPKQFENPDNVKCHEIGIGKEISNIKIDAFVAGIGTGGTLMGIAKALPKIKIIGVHAQESFHNIEGISDGIIPKIINVNLIDKIIKIKSKDAIERAKKIAKEQGLFVGISSGANVLAAEIIAKKLNNVITVLPDSGERYPEIW